MKLKKCATFLIAFLMACGLSIGAMGAMVSGLNLPVENMDGLYQAWAIAALAGCVIFLFKRGWIAALVLTMAGLVWLWPEYAFTLPVRALITRLSTIYDAAYDWGVLEFAGVEWRDVALDLPLCVWGCLIALSAAGTVMQGRWPVLTLLLTLLPVASTVVVTNTVPDEPYVFMVMLTVPLLVLTATVRRQNPHQGAKLTAMAALPVGLLLAALFSVYPKDTYVNRSEEQLNSIASWWNAATSFSFDNTGLISQAPVGPNASATANLSRVGPRNLWGYTVMEVTADYSDTVYLRGQDFDIYDGTSWSASADRAEWFGLGDMRQSTGTLTIRTPNESNVLYVPYYPHQGQTFSGGRTENGDGVRQYTYAVDAALSYASTDVVAFDGSDVVTAADLMDDGYTGSGSAFVTDTDRYLTLPASTRAWAEDYVAQIAEDNGLDGSVRLTTSAAVWFIADHVRNSAVYDTNTPRMSGDYDDFAQWFLEESDTGYCVHFATATTVLLRAAGVPARYVTGYMFESVDGETVEVTADQAHAWVEYYDPGTGAWVVLESTPPDLREEETEPTETQPEETEPPTEVPSEEENQTWPDGTQSGQQDDPKIDLTPLWTALKWLLVPVTAWLAVLVQYHVRRNSRRKNHAPNPRALRLWQDVEALCRVTGQEPPEELEALAQKAKFSQHTLTAEELKAFHTWLKAEREKPMPWYLRFVCRYMLALW